MDVEEKPWSNWTRVCVEGRSADSAMAWLHHNDCHYWKDRYSERDSFMWFFGPFVIGGMLVSIPNPVGRIFYISNPEIAMRFKLTWG